MRRREKLEAKMEAERQRAEAERLRMEAEWLQMFEFRFAECQVRDTR